MFIYMTESKHRRQSRRTTTQGRNMWPTLQPLIQRIRLKIGIHTGRVISGVVGARKPQYALFGDTVNTASRMKTTGERDMIHVSNATYSLLKDDDELVWDERTLQVKGKGTLQTFLLKQIAYAPDYPEFGKGHMDAVDVIRVSIIY